MESGTQGGKIHLSKRTGAFARVTAIKPEAG